MHVGKEGVGGVINGVKLIIDALILLLDLSERNIVFEEKEGIICDDCDSGKKIAVIVDQFESDCGVERSNR